MSLHSFVVALTAVLVWFVAGWYCGGTSSLLSDCGTEAETGGTVEVANAKGDIGEITGREKGQIYASFRLSAKTGETALEAINIITAPAQVTVERRTNGSIRSSFARVIAEHIGSTVIRSRFGLLTFKHIIHSNHSLLSRVCVLLI